MTDFLKGNFKVKGDVDSKENESTSLEEIFEKEALKKLGGSITYVSKKKVVWDDSDLKK
jgi:hypothetical protein